METDPNSAAKQLICLHAYCRACVHNVIVDGVDDVSGDDEEEEEEQKKTNAAAGEQFTMQHILLVRQPSEESSDASDHG